MNVLLWPRPTPVWAYCVMYTELWSDAMWMFWSFQLGIQTPTRAWILSWHRTALDFKPEFQGRTSLSIEDSSNQQTRSAQQIWRRFDCEALVKNGLCRTTDSKLHDNQEKSSDNDHNGPKIEDVCRLESWLFWISSLQCYSI